MGVTGEISTTIPSGSDIGHDDGMKPLAANDEFYNRARSFFDRISTDSNDRYVCGRGSFG